MASLAHTLAFHFLSTWRSTGLALSTPVLRVVSPVRSSTRPPEGMFIEAVEETAAAVPPLGFVLLVAALDAPPWTSCGWTMAALSTPSSVLSLSVSSWASFCLALIRLNSARMSLNPCALAWYAPGGVCAASPPGGVERAAGTLLRLVAGLLLGDLALARASACVALRTPDDAARFTLVA